MLWYAKTGKQFARIAKTKSAFRLNKVPYCLNDKALCFCPVRQPEYQIVVQTLALCVFGWFSVVWLLRSLTSVLVFAARAVSCEIAAVAVAAYGMATGWHLSGNSYFCMRKIFAIMKIIVVEPDTTCNKTTHRALDIESGCTRVSTLADTTLLTHGKPVFVPDWGGDCRAAVCVALRLSRLGKNIPQRFAGRYYDAVGLAVKFELCELKKTLVEAGKQWGMAENFDGAVACGGFAELKDADAEIRCKFENVEKTAGIQGFRSVADEAVATASRYLSIRQGDVLLLPLEETGLDVVPDMHVEGWLCCEKLLEFNIK